MHKLLTCLCFIMVVTFSQEEPEKMFQENIDPLEDNVLEKQQLQMESQYEHQQQYNLNQWVRQEIQEFDQTQQIITRQSFSFQLDKELDFKWNPSKQGHFKIMVEVFTGENGDVLYPQNPDQHEYVMTEIRPEGSKIFKEVGKTYVKKIFNVPFMRDYQIIKVKNYFSKKMLVQISVQDSNFVPTSGIKDDILKLSNEKMSAVMAQLKETELKREKLYRAEWSFKDREERHQSQMLILTGVELFVIITTAIVQMYCIKNLLQNRSIV